MGFFKNFFDKLNSGFFYVVDKECLLNYLTEELQFSLENNLAACANLYVYIGEHKHHVSIWNYAATNEDQDKGVKYYYDEEEYSTIDDLYQSRLVVLPDYFKIELIDGDSVYLNEYQAVHPNLKLEDY